MVYGFDPARTLPQVIPWTNNYMRCTTLGRNTSGVGVALGVQNNPLVRLSYPAVTDEEFPLRAYVFRWGWDNPQNDLMPRIPWQRPKMPVLPRSVRPPLIRF
jgi:hypothetical protein